ncbi:hypothetical protein BDR07DRAFT_1410556 [Suillus spraguei]|nr:hypothetical protein BDR07DRAFT_1410556 [Suillus spraguei]
MPTQLAPMILVSSTICASSISSGTFWCFEHISKDAYITIILYRQAFLQWKHNQICKGLSISSRAVGKLEA